MAHGGRPVLLFGQHGSTICASGASGPTPNRSGRRDRTPAGPYASSRWRRPDDHLGTAGEYGHGHGSRLVASLNRPGFVEACRGNGTASAFGAGLPLVPREIIRSRHIISLRVIARELHYAVPRPGVHRPSADIGSTRPMVCGIARRPRAHNQRTSEWPRDRLQYLCVVQQVCWRLLHVAHTACPRRRPGSANLPPAAAPVGP
jgi:hypothetical protein